MGTLTSKQESLYTSEIKRYNSLGMEKICGIDTYLKSRLEKFERDNNKKLYYDMYEVVQYAENDY